MYNIVINGYVITDKTICENHTTLILLRYLKKYDKLTHHLWTFPILDIFANDKIGTDFCLLGQQCNFYCEDTDNLQLNSDCAGKILYSLRM